MFYRAIVVDNIDPENARRVKVRVLGIHPMEDETDFENVPDEVLPWAVPNIPITVGKNKNNIGVFDVPDVGDYVRVFFEDRGFQKPVYFGLIGTMVDVNNSFVPGSNRVVEDRFGNTLNISDSLINMLDCFSNNVSFSKDKITITSNNGNTLELNSSNNSISIKTPKKGSIVIDDDNDIMIDMNQSKIEMTNDGHITIYSKNGSNETLDFNKFLQLFNTHTHTAPLGLTTPPAHPMTLFEHAFDSVEYGPKPYKVTKTIGNDSDHDASQDPVGTEYTPDSILPGSLQAAEGEVMSTILNNGTSNPSTDEMDGPAFVSSSAPNYTGEVITTTPYYEHGVKTRDGKIVSIQGKGVDSEMAKSLYEMIKASQIDNMTKYLKYLIKKSDKYYVTKKGSLVLTKDDGENYEEGEMFDLSETYLNTKCPYSLVVINSGVRSHKDDIFDKKGNLLCRSQLSIRKRFAKRKNMSEQELMTSDYKKYFNPPTANPGWSKHQCGIAVDFNTRGQNQLSWLKSNAGRYSFKQTFLPNEPWHFQWYKK